MLKINNFFINILICVKTFYFSYIHTFFLFSFAQYFRLGTASPAFLDRTSLIFRLKVLFLLFKSKQKVTVEIFVSTRVLFATAILTISLLSENSTNSFKAETRT